LQWKKFAILGSRYRGHLNEKPERLQAIVDAIAAIVCLQTTLSPLRYHQDLLAPEAIDQIAQELNEEQSEM
jgi:hypothetical protein